MIKPSPPETMRRVTSSEPPKPSAAERGAALMARMKELGVKGRDLARHAGISPTTMYAAFKGDASPETLAAIEDALNDAAEDPANFREHPREVQKLGEGLIEFEISLGAADVKVVVRGAMKDAAELEARALDALRHLKASESD